MEKQAIIWFRNDLRLQDNPAFHYAVSQGYSILPVFIMDTNRDDEFSVGSAGKWFLHHALGALETSLHRHHTQLHIARGKPQQILQDLCVKHNVTAVFWNRQYQPYTRQRDKAVKAALSENGITVKSFNGRLLREPWTMETGSGGPYRVFSPFWRACVASDIDPHVLPEPTGVHSVSSTGGLSLGDLKLLPTTPDWAEGMRDMWDISEAAAQQRLEAFLESALSDYKQARNFPAGETTSKLSPYLQWGLISPGQIWQKTKDWMRSHGKTKDKNPIHFLSELGWREFSYHLLYHFPDLPSKNLNARFDEFPWQDPDPKLLTAWQKGQTGYPLIDAAMRELWITGWMHNRTRMVVGSFLVKHLLIHWHYGESWFWDTLVDADLANNSASWQWIAGCGADAAPYFRIFNPLLQSQRFDPKGEYIRKWVPELAQLSNEHIHQPSAAPREIRESAGIRLGETYPFPIIDHKTGRERALKAYDQVRG